MSAARSFSSPLQHCLNLANTLKSVYGPVSSDKLVIRKSAFKDTPQQEVHVTNDGATLLRLLTRNRSSVNPVHLFLSEISESQEIATGDGTTSVILFSCFVLEELERVYQKEHNKGRIISVMNEICSLLLKYGMIREKYHNQSLEQEAEDSLQSETGPSSHSLIHQSIQSTLQSKILKNDASWISDHLIIPLIQHYRQCGKSFKKKNIQFVSVTGGDIRDSSWIRGVAFKRGLVYAGHQQQKQHIKNPRIILTSDEIEWKHMKENIKVNFDPESYEELIDFEWNQCQEKMDAIVASGANLVLSSKSIGDIATQYFSRHGITSVGNVDSKMLERLSLDLDAPIVTSLIKLKQDAKADPLEHPEHEETIISNSRAFVGTNCSEFIVTQINNEPYCLLKGIPEPENTTLLIHGSSPEVLSESIRCFDDILGVTECLLNSNAYTYGGGFLEMHLACVLESWDTNSARGENSADISPIRDSSVSHLSIPETYPRGQLSHVHSLCLKALSRALTRIVETLCENASYPVRETITQLKQEHFKVLKNSVERKDAMSNKEDSTKEHLLSREQRLSHFGISPDSPAIQNMSHVIEPCSVKEGYIMRGVQAACILFSVSDITQESSAKTYSERGHQRYESYKSLLRDAKKRRSGLAGS